MPASAYLFDRCIHGKFSGIFFCFTEDNGSTVAAAVNLDHVTEHSCPLWPVARYGQMLQRKEKKGGQKEKQIETEWQTREGEETFSIHWIQLDDLVLFFVTIQLVLLMIKTAIFTCWPFLMETYFTVSITCPYLQATLQTELNITAKNAVTLVKQYQSHTRHLFLTLTSTVVAAFCVFLPIRSTCLQPGLMYFLATS